MLLPKKGIMRVTFATCFIIALSSGIILSFLSILIFLQCHANIKPFFILQLSLSYSETLFLPISLFPHIMIHDHACNPHWVCFLPCLLMETLYME